MATIAHPTQRSTNPNFGSLASCAIGIMAIPAAEIAFVQGQPIIVATNDAYTRAALNDSRTKAMLLAEVAA